MDARIVGWGHTPFGVHKDKTLEDLIQDAAAEAIELAGLVPADIDAIWLGHFNAGMVPDAFASSLVLGLDDGLRFKPAARVENACASGSAAIFAARDAIRAGSARRVLVIGAEKMTELDTKGVTKALACASYSQEENGVSFPQIFGRIAAGYFQKYGDVSEALARIAVKNHQNALANPLAQMQRDVSFEFCNSVSDKNPMIAPPLRLTDCSLISDGAAALVMVADDMIEEFDRAVGFRGAAQVNDVLPMSQRDMTELTAARYAFARAYHQAGVTVRDIDLAELHDCFTIAELMIYEAMGLATPGKGADRIADGTVMRDGALPVNLSGGLKAKGHPVGATGVSMHVMAVRQVTGTAGDMQKKDASLACVFNMGGSGVANYCSILEAVR
ncbi:acetyl-CoA acetyltransferase [Aliiroseovarius sp. S1339]|uniref:acetyl-CoA acetyltransferase n=1 Tax=Aliiroseovarius sp. S1339 TaxID=2936990 RepID=UPI0020BEA8A8|nr:acetyl-CoA acetyltransferase [Aliiroseovarius sp. S1339]MCK8465061.1 acetyl-CoA acetyltransferase [Aliiroseovarius sp. S1339]